MSNSNSAAEAIRFYAALAAGDRAALDELLDPSFVGVTADGMPFSIGGVHQGADAMRRDVWGMIAKNFDARAEPEHFLELVDGRLLITGRYRGHGKNGGSTLDAAFAHLLTFEHGRIVRLEQHTDTARWRDAASDLRTVQLEIADAVATVRLNRPKQGNAINADMADDLLEVATRIAENSNVRAVLITGNGPHFTVGGDLATFVNTGRLELPNQLRRMVDSFHVAIERFTSMNAPIVAAVRGGVGGGGLALLHVADIAIASEEARFSVGYSALGLTSDGGSTYFLPRMVGLRKAQELFLLNRRLTAQEALDFGLVTRLAKDADVEATARAIATKLAAGPTRAFGQVRRLLRQSLETNITVQLDAEKASLIEASRTDDAREGIAAFIEKRAAQFRGT